MFLVLNRTQALCPKIIPTDEGSRIVVSQELNTPSIVWALGGHRFENLLLKGEVSTICSDNVSKQMMADVRYSCLTTAIILSLKKAAWKWLMVLNCTASTTYRPSVPSTLWISPYGTGALIDSGCFLISK